MAVTMSTRPFATAKHFPLRQIEQSLPRGVKTAVVALGFEFFFLSPTVLILATLALEFERGEFRFAFEMMVPFDPFILFFN